MSDFPGHAISHEHPLERFDLVARTDHVQVGTLPLDAWLAAEDHPRRRNSLRNTRAAHWDDAREATGAVQEMLRHVTGALFQGTLYKVRGHTRSDLWTKGKLPLPETVFATIYTAASKAELAVLYAATHPPTAVLSAVDRVSGAYREAGLDITSRRLRGGSILAALNIALRGAAPPNQPKDLQPLDVYKSVALFRNEIEQLDSLKPQPAIFYNGIIAAALIGLTLYPQPALDFFDRLSSRNGNKRDGKLDPVEALLAHIATIPPQRVGWIKSHQEQLCRKALRALVTWVEHDTDPDALFWRERPLSGLDLAPYIARVRQAKGIETDSSL